MAVVRRDDFLVPCEQPKARLDGGWMWMMLMADVMLSAPLRRVSKMQKSTNGNGNKKKMGGGQTTRPRLSIDKKDGAGAWGWTDDGDSRGEYEMFKRNE